MNLQNRFWFGGATLVTPLLFLGGLSVWNLYVQGRAMNAATAEYALSEHAKAASAQVGWLRDSLRGADARTFFDVKYFAPIQVEISRVQQNASVAIATDDGDAGNERRLSQEIATRLEKSVSQVADQSPTPASTAAAASTLDQLFHSLAMAADFGPEAARRRVIVAQAGISQRTMWALMWFAIALAFSAAVHYKQYRLLVLPLLCLRDDMRKSVATEYRTTIAGTGEGEFHEVAGYFNSLVRELAELYRGLEEKIIARSRELVRSERLASVGFLAAGVAHEINNPLSVISGYAELSTKKIRHVLTDPGHGAAAMDGDCESQAKAEAEALTEVLEAQGIIREEAFRCKEITNRLLSLARGGSDNREFLSLNKVAEQVSVLIKGLRNYRDRRITLSFRDSDALDVLANATEMKQVLLNLTVNALEASPSHSGEVRIGGQRSGEWIECFVEDNGKGMTRDVLDQIFEPFFTAKRGAGEPGTGLGLSITHAIIENHGGRIRAESDGPGRGSRFTFRLPAAQRTAAPAPLPALISG
jgi:two-component system, NtrC family, sensor kinase